jgi:predicted DsbA family dithiol-disulfide isomerase
LSISRPVAAAILIALLCAAAGFGGGWWLGDREGRKAGFAVGKRYGEVQAAKRPPVLVRDEAISVERLTAAGVFSMLPDLSESLQTRLATLLNRGITPCEKYAQRGVSLARSLVDPERGCGLEMDQVPLALAALQTFEDLEDALAVLRVERRGHPDVEGRPRLGSPDAQIVLVEYSDFQCPYCVRTHKKIRKLVEGRDDVALVYKHFPLRRHAAALSAAIAAEAASEQGRFWEMHDALFGLGRSIGEGIDGKVPVPPEGPVYFEAEAESIGLDLDRYRVDFRSERVRDRVDADREEAERLGIRGTPTFLLGGVRVRPGPGSDRLTRQIARARAESEGRFSWDLPKLPEGVSDPTVDAP